MKENKLGDQSTAVSNDFATAIRKRAESNFTATIRKRTDSDFTKTFHPQMTAKSPFLDENASPHMSKTKIVKPKRKRSSNKLNRS